MVLAEDLADVAAVRVAEYGRPLRVLGQGYPGRDDMVNSSEQTVRLPNAVFAPVQSDAVPLGRNFDCFTGVIDGRLFSFGVGDESHSDDQHPDSCCPGARRSRADLPQSTEADRAASSPGRPREL